MLFVQNLHCSQGDMTSMLEFLEKYQKSQKDPQYLSEINSMFSSWSHLLSGKPAPTLVSYKNVLSKMVKFSLNSL